MILFYLLCIIHALKVSFECINATNYSLNETLDDDSVIEENKKVWELFNRATNYFFSKVADFWGYCFGYPEDEPLELASTSVPEQTESTSELLSTTEEAITSLSRDNQSQTIEEPSPVKKSTFRLNPQTPEFFPSYTKWIIKRNQFPVRLIELIDDLKVQFPDAKFYLTGASPSNILDRIKPNDYDILVINLDLNLLQKYLASKKVNLQKRSEKFPILFCDLGAGVAVDFSAKKMEAAEHVRNVLEMDYLSRDFNLSALYVEFTAANEFPVFSFGDVLRTRHAKIIESIGEPLEVLVSDPTRLFRLAKLLITNPTYNLGPKLQYGLQELTKKQPGTAQWLSLLESFLKTEYGNHDRLDQAMRKLFERYSYQEINKAFQKMGLLTAFTNNTYEDVERACSRIPEVASGEQYIYWIMANILKYAENGNEHALFPWHSILNLSGTETDFLDFIYGKAYNQESGVFVALPEIHELIDSFQLVAANLENQHCLTK